MVGSIRAFLDPPYYNRDAFWSCLFLLIDFYLCDPPEKMFGRELNLRNILVFVDFWSCVRIENFFFSCARPEEVFAREKITIKINNKIIGLVLTAAERHNLVLRLS